MATSTTSRTPLGSPDRARGPGRTFLRALLVLTVGGLVLAAGSLIGLRLARAGVLPGATVDGVALGGVDAPRAQQRLTLLADRKADAEIIARRSSESSTSTAAELGYVLDVDATLETVLYRGRQGNPVVALRDHLRAFRSPTPIPPVERVDDETLQQWATATARQLEKKPEEGGLRFEGATVTPVDPEPGATVDARDLATRARQLALSGGGTVDVATDQVEPRTTEDDVDEVLARAEQALSGDVTLRRSSASVTLTPSQIAGLLRTKVTDNGIRLRVDPSALRKQIGETTIAALETEPRSARFDIDGGSINLVKATKGFSYAPRMAARQLLTVATGTGERRATLDGKVEDPDLTTAEAKDLDIVEKVSTFTTHHACCEGRVTNIHRIADIVDDVIIEPGETFSLNDFVGERTEAKGFVNGGAIFEGEFVEQIGGGVSQFTTTAYNAAYFGGYDIVEHKAHSYYISRYPVGREATLNYPTVDLKIRNNSPHGMVLSTSYTDTSVTVSVYGTKWVKVDSETGPRRNITKSETIYKETDEIPKGRRRVIQEAGASGFDITVTRILTFPDGEVRREPVTTTYLPQPRIIERNT